MYYSNFYYNSLKILVKTLPNFLKPDIVLSKITKIDKSYIKELKSKYNIEGIILDVDNTLRKDMRPIPLYIKQWLEELIKEVKVIVVSNGYDNNIANYLKSIDIKYIPLANKPMKKGLLKAIQELNIEANKILVIGDSVIDDVLGGKRCKTKTCLVSRLR